MKQYHVVIIGGGIGGLSCALRLLHAGYKVSIYEKCPEVGGVMQHMPNASGYANYDSFASIGISPQSYSEIFTDIGLNPADYFSQIYLKELYRFFYEDGTSFTLRKNAAAYAYEFESFYKEPFTHYSDFVHTFYEKYLLAYELILSRPLMHLEDMMSFDKLCPLMKLGPLVSASSAIKRRFNNPKLRDCLLFQSYYMGFPPSRISQLYATIPAYTGTLGLTHIKGGMGAYIHALKKAFIDLKGQLYCNTPIKRILTYKNEAYGVLTRSGEMKKADVVISNADYHFTITKLLGRSMIFKRPLLSFEMTCSVFMLRLTLSTCLPRLITHNIYLVQNTEQAFSDVMRGTMPLKFPMYIYYPSAIDESFNKGTSTTLNLMVRVPNLSFNEAYWTTSTTQHIRALCLKHLADIVGMKSIEPYILHESISTPNELAEKFNCYQGAGFGLAPSMLQSAWLKPQPVCSFIKNLYFTGTSIHPGNGTYIVMEGAKIVSELIKKHYPLNK